MNYVLGYQRRSMYLLVECRDMLKQILQNYPGASLVHNEPTLELEQQGNLEDFQNFDISLNDKRTTESLIFVSRSYLTIQISLIPLPTLMQMNDYKCFII